MTGSGGLFSILISTKSRVKIETFCKTLETFLFAVSWGGHESLILPFCSIMDVDNHPEPGVPINLIRFYIGLEDADYLIRDLENAFKAIA
jgi:cystathionine beta-lyase/cystathionine gamma-synthase